MIKSSLLLVAFMLVSPIVLSAEYTDYFTVNAIQLDGSSENFFVDRTDEVGLGVVGCTGAIRVMIDNSVKGRKEIFSMALAAKLAGKQLRFYGNCSPTVTHYFNAYWVELK